MTLSIHSGISAKVKEFYVSECSVIQRSIQQKWLASRQILTGTSLDLEQNNVVSVSELDESYLSLLFTTEVVVPTPHFPF